MERENVTILDHPLIQHKISMLRDERTGTNEFRKLVEEIATLMGFEAVTKDKVKTKRLTFTAPTIKRGTMKTRGQTYKIRKAKKSYSVKLKKNLKKKQKVSFYGKDKDGNKFYRTYYVN